MNNLPIGYTLCEYIESNGTQWIDTGIVGKSGVKSVIDMALMKGGASIPLGCYSPQRCYLVSFNNDSSLRYGYVDWITSQFIPIIGERYVIETDFSIGNQLLRVDDKTIASSSIGTLFSNNHTIYAFAYNDGGKPGDYSSLRMYSLKLYDNGILVRDYIPCMNANNVYGLYDKVNGVFYTSATDSGFTGKWAEDKKLLVSPSEFRKRLMMLAVTDKKPDYSKLRGVFIEDIDGCLYTQSEWDGSKIPNGVAVLTENCRFVVYGYYYNNSLFEYQSPILNSTSYLDDSFPTFSYSDMVTDYDGMGNTDKLLSYEEVSIWNAAGKCRMTVFPNGQTGYLGAAGEWKALLDNFDSVNSALSKAGMKILDYYSQMYWWTSTCYMTGSIQSVWFGAFNMRYKNIDTVNATSEQYYRPFTKLKFDN